ncbi:hypothetical protein AaE_012870, partial [Aphanomyces astaci]
TGDGLYIHWRDTINKQVAAFASALKLSTSIVRSGYNTEQYMADADEYFKAQKWNKKQTPFKLVHCWEIPKDQPKWQRASNVASDGPGVAAVPASVLTAPSAIALAQEKRPIGSKRAKLAQLGNIYRYYYIYVINTAKMHADLVAAMVAKNAIAQRALDATLFTVPIPDDSDAKLFFSLKRKEALMRAQADVRRAENAMIELGSKRPRRLERRRGGWDIGGGTRTVVLGLTTNPGANLSYILHYKIMY